MLASPDKITLNLAATVEYLRAGEVVAFPTETVYGLGADARNPAAIQKIFQIKGRPADHPLIVHIASSAELENWAIEIPDEAWILAKQFWPGPLTMILKKHSSVSSLITGGQNTLAIRIPNHPLALKLLEQFGSGLVGPSANKYGRVSPTTAAHVSADLGPDLAAILDGGPCRIGIESTIICLADTAPVVMRQGVITAAEISELLKMDVPVQSVSSIKSSGSHNSHYAPHTPVYLIHAKDLMASVLAQVTKHLSFSVISLQPKPIDLLVNAYWQQMSSDPMIYAHDIYAALRKHDQLGTAAILIEQVPSNNLAWAAIADRLSRASFKK